MTTTAWTPPVDDDTFTSVLDPAETHPDLPVIAAGLAHVTGELPEVLTVQLLHRDALDRLRAVAPEQATPIYTEMVGEFGDPFAAGVRFDGVVAATDRLIAGDAA